MKQIGLALHSYHDIHRTLPFGQALFTIGDSLWIKALPHLEQSALYNSVNQSRSIFDTANRTIRAATLVTYLCPSDFMSGVRNASTTAFDARGFVVGAADLPSFFTSYVASFGTTDTTAHILPDSRGFARPDGVVNDISPLSMESIGDGTSHTFLVSERATAFLQQLVPFNPEIVSSFGLYYKGSLGDTLFTSMYPPNMPRKVAVGAGISHTAAVSSLHPAGFNMLMCDGSVRYVKDSISSWPYDSISGFPLGSSSGPGGFWNNLPLPGVWQRLTTRSGGEIEGSESF